MAHLSSPGKWSLLMDAFCETSLSDALVSGPHEAGLWPCTQVRCSSGRQTPGILKSPSVSFGPVWISAGSSPRENRCDCTMILMSFCRKAPFKNTNPERKEQKQEAALTSRLLQEFKFYKFQTHCNFCFIHRHTDASFLFFFLVWKCGGPIEWQRTSSQSRGQETDIDE